MNADGSPGVSVDASVGSEGSLGVGLGIGLVVGGASRSVIGAVLLVIGIVAARPRRRRST